jgi:hypothetical protein
MDETFWEQLDEDLRTSPFGLAYNSQFPVDPIEDIRYPQDPGREMFS